MASTWTRPGGHSLVVRLDNLGDVLLTGPAVRAVAAGSARCTMLCGPAGAPAAELLPGVDDVVAYAAPWVADPPPPFRSAELEQLVARIADVAPDRALVSTSFHQSPLPVALALRLAGVPFVAAFSEDYPGSLLDLRLHQAQETHEVERNLELAAAAGFSLPAGDDGRLAVRLPEAPARVAARVVLHPGASVPARTWPPARFAVLARALVDAGHDVVVTGSAGEAGLVEEVVAAAVGIRSLVGAPLDVLANCLASAGAVVAGNTGPAHLAAAVGTPVVSLFPPTVPAARWRPYGVPHVLLGRQDVACSGCRARRCPRPVQECLDPVGVGEVRAALEALGAARPLAGAPAPAPAPAVAAAATATGAGA